MGKQSSAWLLSAALSLGIVLFIADTKSLLPSLAQDVWVQSVFLGIGGLVTAPFLIAHYVRSASRESDGAFAGTVFARKPVIVALPALAFAAGVVLCRAVAPIEALPGQAQAAIVMFGSLLRGAGGILLLVAWLECAAMLGERPMLRAAGIALIISGAADTVAYTIGNACAFWLAIVLAAVFPLVYYRLTVVTELGIMRDDTESGAISSPVSDGIPSRVPEFSGGAYAAGMLLLLTFLLTMLNPLLRAPLSSLLEQGFTIDGTRICTGLGFVLGGVMALLIVRLSTSATSAPALMLVVIAQCELLYLLSTLLSGIPILQVLLCGAARKTSFLIMFAAVPMQRRMANRMVYAMLSIACASLALLASGLLTSALLALGDGFETPIRVTILVLTFSLMTLCIARFLGLFDTQGEDAGTSAGNAFLDGKGLTERESQIAMLLACGLSSNEIASSLYLSASTIRVHASRVYAKCGVSSQAEFMAAYYGNQRREGLATRADGTTP